MGGGDGTGEERTGAARRRFAEAAREERPDLALLCLLIGAEAATRGSLRGGRDTGNGNDGNDNSDDSDDSDNRDGGDGRAVRGAARGAAPDPVDEEAAVDRLVDEGQAELDRLAGLLPFGRGRTPAEWAAALERTLGGELGFGGSAPDYRRLESSLLTEVLRRRRGLPILLSVVWTEVARRAGAPVYGVALPGHFVVGFGDPAGAHVLADPFGGGTQLGEDELAVMVAGATGGTPLSAASLRPAGPLETVLRILNNIRAWAAPRPERSGVRLWAVELSLLLPHHPGRLRFERAQLLVERGHFLRGAREMEEYADVVATMEPNAAENVRRAARAARARLN
ncbi:transglutaminase-like domain-containing protein [Streptomyces qinglanensis]|uniref:Regulator of sirC expression, contains transglutaminase-like and TPR domains n=1 Tax=Streptomyces qinglanensis TaxID=943816 RepID=A0A1H9UTL3_9ACTN|nr:transglutaminase-like domain-containing protein [Streptomyces qinglanensis]SES12825.1 Regulator of sirC expression, contains transglutaminase-like and TPR domains [Streptomyces qinglanensis]